MACPSSPGRIPERTASGDKKPKLRRNAGCYRKVKLNTYINCQLIINVTTDWILKTETASECAGSERQRSVTDLDSTAFSDL